MCDDEATAVLLANLDGEPLALPNQLRFLAGHRAKAWDKNVVALGLAGGFLEPLRSTAIHLVQIGHRPADDAVPDARFGGPRDRALQPRDGCSSIVDIRDFLVLHYMRHRARRHAVLELSAANIAPPEGLAEKIAMFRSSGRVFREHNELFTETSWEAVLVGQGISAGGYHPAADLLPDDETLLPARLDPRHDRRDGGADADARRNSSSANGAARSIRRSECSHDRAASSAAGGGGRGGRFLALSARDPPPARRPVVMRGLAADWPGVAAAATGRRAPSSTTCSVSRPDARRGRRSWLRRPRPRAGSSTAADVLTGLNFTAHQGRLGAFLGEACCVWPTTRSRRACRGAVGAHHRSCCRRASSKPTRCRSGARGAAPRIWIGNRIRVAPHYDLMENIGVCLREGMDLEIYLRADRRLCPEVLIVGAILGNMKLTKPQAANAGELFGLTKAETAMLNEVHPMRAENVQMPPQDPLIYRFYEMVMVNGPAWKALIEEEFGDGIMSAIDFDMVMQRIANPIKGDRVQIARCPASSCRTSSTARHFTVMCRNMGSKRVGRGALPGDKRILSQLTSEL